MTSKKKGDGYVRPTGTGPAMVNQHAPLFNDRRTKRNRDKRTQKRRAIEDSQDG